MEVSAFNRLEQKIEELLNRLGSLKEENQKLRAELEEQQRRASELTELKDGLEQERSQVRQRIEGLVQRLEEY